MEGEFDVDLILVSHIKFSLSLLHLEGNGRNEGRS